MSSCTVCNKSDTSFCKRCKSARYCSPTCQKKDWPTHKLICAVFSSFDSSSRPTDQHFRAFLFPVDDRNPKVVWLHCPWREDEDDHVKYQHPDLDPFLGSDAFPRNAPIQYNPVLKRKLSNTIYVSHRDGFLVDGSRPNTSIAAITATKPWQCHDWRGPLIAYKKAGLGIDQLACRDLDLTDFRNLADYLLAYNSKPISASQQVTGRKVMGVRINCLGDRKILSKPDFEAVEVLPTDSIFSQHDTSDITERVGLPMFTQRCSPDPRWANGHKPDIFHESSDDLSTGRLGWGWAPMQWQNNVGSTIVVRQDEKPLSPLHAEALCKYCRYEIRPLFGHSMGEYGPDEPMSKDAVLAMICPATFGIYWYKLLGEKHKAGEYPKDSYPYDV